MEILLDRVREAVFLVDGEGRVALWNAAAEGLIGAGPDDVLGHDVEEVLDLRPLREGGALPPLSQPHALPFADVCEVCDGDGRWLPVHLRLDPLPGSGGFSGVIRDLRSEVGVAGDAGRAERTLASVLEASPVPIVGLDPAGRVEMWTPAATRVFGWAEEDVLGRRLPTIHESEWPRFQSLIDRVVGGEPFVRRETQCLREDGGIISVLVSASQIRGYEGRIGGVIAVLSDISESKRLEAQLRQAQKMEAVGRLAGGVAHDFNNILTGIAGLTELILFQLAPEDPVRADVLQIERAVERAADLTGKLLAFSRQQVLRPRVIELGAAVTSMEALLRGVVSGGVELRTEIEDEGCLVRADRSHLERVVLNLVVNASDAMPDGGRLTLKVRRETLTPEEAGSYSYPVRAGEYVRLSVEDSGVGMDEEVLRQVFEPFFTTKDEGTGLGLSTAYGIVKQSGGYIWADSSPGRGTLFRVYLPLVSDREGPGASRPWSADPGGTRAVEVPSQGDGHALE